MRLTSCLFLFGLALGLVGCQSADKERQLVGTWTSNAGNLVLKEDKTFTMGEGAGTTEGKWAVADKGVKLTVEKMGGKPKAEAMKEFEDTMRKAAAATGRSVDDMLKQVREAVNDPTFKLSEDMKTLTWTISGQDMTFTKKEA